MNLKDPSDINKAAGLCLVDESDRHYFSMLPVGHGIIKLQDRWSEPFVLRFPLVDLNKGFVSDEVLRRFLRDQETDSLPSEHKNSNFDPPRRIRFSDHALNETDLRFLEDVFVHRTDGVKTRYLRLGFSVDRGNRIKNQLIRDGWLDSEVIPIGQGRMVLLRISKKGAETLGLASEKTIPGIEGLAHEYWKSHWAEKMRQRGWRTVLEASRRGGRVDILAVSSHGRERIGIEIETGKSDSVANAKNCLLSDFDRIIIVATDRRALQTVEKELGSAGLLGLQRIRVLLASANFPD